MNFIRPLAVCLAVCALVTRARAQSYHGILINGALGGTQIYDPFNTPHARGNLQLASADGQQCVRRCGSDHRRDSIFRPW